MRACFDRDGFLLWAAAGEIAPGAPAGSTMVEIDAHEPGRLFYDRGAGRLVTAPQEVVIVADRTAVVPGDAGARLTLPNPCWLLVDGLRVRVTGGSYVVAPAVAGVTRVELAGPHRSEPLLIVAQPLADVEAALLSQIDADAGEARRTWLTIAPGQSDAYREKMVDVAALAGLGGTTALILAALKLLSPAEQQTRWPFLYAEMQARGLTTLVQARDAIVAAANASRTARAEIERRRRAGKIAIRAATTIAAKRVAYDAVGWN